LCLHYIINNKGDKWAKNWPKSIEGLNSEKMKIGGSKSWFLI
jgi:hypothetical protein